MKKVIIAVDAGGTSTRVNVIDKDKNILFDKVYACGSPAVLGDDDEAFANIYGGVSDAYAFSQDECFIEAIIIGISGLDVVKNIDKYKLEFEEAFNAEVLITQDAVLAIYSIVTDMHNEGILVLSGTGSAVMAIKNNQTRLYGGWGRLLTEVGSAYTTVRDLINSMIRNYEAGNEVTTLGKRFLERLGYSNVKELKYFVYPSTSTKIAGHAKFVSDAAHIDNNEEAIAILQKGGYDLALDVQNAYKGLNLSSDAVIGFRGGFISNAPIMQNELILQLEKIGINLKVVAGDKDPIYGAFYMAKRMGYLC